MGFPVHRMRRLRNDPRIRKLVEEVTLPPNRFIYPLFIAEKLPAPEPIESMPGQSRWPVGEIAKPVQKAFEAGVRSFLLFGLPQIKDSKGSSSRDPEGVIPKALRALKKEFPEAFLITDVCLCAYTDHGHCGMLDEQGRILNDETLPLLSEMALVHARAGADMVAPSDMMDGRVEAIRHILDARGFRKLPIMAYSAKFASSFYGPFRDAAHSAPAEGDRKGYQMDPHNLREALREMELDLSEGADVLMVKPGLPYLDVIAAARKRFDCPISAYQVSGEYSMIKAAAANGWIDEKSVVMESLLAIRRAGADLILTYFAPEAARWFKERE